MMKRLLLVGVLLLGSALAAIAQPVPVAVTLGGAPVSGSNPFPVTGTFSASLAGFQPSAAGARGTPLTVTTADSSGALPTGTVVDVSNAGTTNPMYCNVNGVAATAADKLIAPQSWFEFTIPSGVTTLHCIATGGSTTANTVGGTGLGTGAGGGSGGSGGSSSITGWAGSTIGTGTIQAFGSTQSTIGAGLVPAINAFVVNTTTALATNADSIAPSGSAVNSPTNSYLYGFDGTNWDRLRVAASTFGLEIAAASGALASGAGTDGWDSTQGAKADAAWAGSGSGSVVSIDKYIAAGIYAPPNLNVNGTNTAWTGVTPGIPQTGTVIAANVSTPIATPITCSALCANLAVKTAAGTLYSFEVSADSTLSGAAWWIMIYNATSAPADGAVTPLKCYAAPSGATSFTGAFASGGISFSTGITIGVSTTGCFNKTASTHALISGDYQ